MIKAAFRGGPINEPNITHWRQGAYRDWQVRQDALGTLRQLGREADAGNLTDQLGLILSARLAVAMCQAPSIAETDDHDRELRRLRDLCAVLVPLRNGDLSAQKLSLKRHKADRKALRCKNQSRSIGTSIP